MRSGRVIDAKTIGPAGGGGADQGAPERGARPCRVEGLERRVLLSAAVANIAGVDTTRDPVSTPPIVVRTTAAPTGNRPAVISPHLSAPFRPVDVRSAYGVGRVAWDGAAGTGAGQTIAVIDAYNDPNLVSDVAAFDAAFNLQPFNATGGPTLKVLNQAGKATGLPANVSAATARVGLGRNAGRGVGECDRAAGEHRPVRGQQ